MANTLTPIIPKVLARALMALREQAVMPRLVNGDYSSDAAKKGATIDVPIPSAVAVTDVTPAAVPPTPPDSAPTTVQITLDNWKKAAFHLTDKELHEIDKDEAYLPMEMSEAVRGLANAINLTIHEEYLGVYGYEGTINAAIGTIFSDTSSAINARKILHQQLAPKANRRGVLDFTAEANALALAAFADAEKVGSAQVKLEGEIGRKFGIDWVSDDQVVTHTAGTLNDGTDHKALINDAAVAVGQTSIDIDSITLTGTVVPGDIFQVAGDAQTYVVTNGPHTAAGNAIAGIEFDPPAKVAWADDAVISFANTHVVNLAFHRDAFAVAMRPLQQTTQELALGNQILSLTDPITGISLRLEVSRQYKQIVWEIDALWGAKLIRAPLATRIAG